MAVKGGQGLGRDIHRGLQGLPGHKDPQDAVGSGGDGEFCGIGIGLLLEGDEVIGALLHPGQPVDDELVGLVPGQPQLGQGVLQKSGGIGAGDAKAPGEVILRGALTLPVQIIISLAGGVGQRAVGSGGDRPAILVGRVGAGHPAGIVQLHGDIGHFLGIEVDDGFGKEDLVLSGCQTQQQKQDRDDDKQVQNRLQDAFENVCSHKLLLSARADVGIGPYGKRTRGMAGHTKLI